ncbi:MULTISPECIES: hypothetical protein [Sorangium]|uniref:Uncharacterized protein n=1 Tax=Sorangium cellulosum TaxID=56 RepID=A0A4P2QP89_SORCE|nr:MULTISPECIES: hypothetical protein [Sorangium]AUX31940.1 uncharacterized protein SOCE836_040750 [Sorangium cellulosum]WCQ91314.1 hypothetical protein NQZ70_04030 [Sorangium sp. Soce836]
MTVDAPLLTCRQVAQLLRYEGSPKAQRVRVRRLIASVEQRTGTTIHRRVGNRWLIPRSAIESLMSPESGLSDRVDDLERQVRDLRDRIEHLEAAGA